MSQPLPIRVTRHAAAQISEAAEWWTLNRPSAPGAMIEELERAFALIAVQPRIGAIARDAKLAGVRRLHLGRVHYHLYYRASPNAVEVLAFWHTHAARALQSKAAMTANPAIWTSPPVSIDDNPLQSWHFDAVSSRGSPFHSFNADVPHAWAAPRQRAAG